MKSHFICSVLCYVIGFTPVAGFQQNKVRIKQFVTMGNGREVKAERKEQKNIKFALLETSCRVLRHIGVNSISSLKGKVITVKAIKTYRGNGGITPFILNLGTA